MPPRGMRREILGREPSRQTGLPLHSMAPFYHTNGDMRYDLTDPPPEIVNIFPDPHVHLPFLNIICTRWRLGENIDALVAGRIRYDGQVFWRAPLADGDRVAISSIGECIARSSIFIHPDGSVSVSPQAPGNVVPSWAETAPSHSPVNTQDFNAELERLQREARAAVTPDGTVYAVCPACGRDQIREWDYEGKMTRFCTRCRHTWAKDDELSVNPEAEIEESNNRQLRDRALRSNATPESAFAIIQPSEWSSTNEDSPSAGYDAVREEFYERHREYMEDRECRDEAELDEDDDDEDGD